MESHDIADIAEQVAEKVTHRIFMVLGTDINNGENLIQLQKDFAHVRAWRENMEAIKKKGFASAVFFIVTGLLGYFLLLFNHK